MISSFKWLYPGMRVKRWLLLMPIGVAAVIAGVVLLANWRIDSALRGVAEEVYFRYGVDLSNPAILIPVSLAFIIIGLVLIFSALRQIVRSITSVVSPDFNGKLVDVIFKRRFLAQGQRIVVIGGGTGLSTMLRGLKQYSSNIVAVVTVTDDGGSSGRLHRDMGMLPPGDIRNCLVALADAEPLMTQLFQYRFQEGVAGLDGHSFGNLLIAAMTRITGDFELAIRETSSILAIRGLVLPSTLDQIRLQAEFTDGTFAEGETEITGSGKPIKHILLHPSSVQPLEETLRSIELADCIVLGPGSVYTSIVPNLLVSQIPQAIEASAAEKIYVCNVMTQPGETDGYMASDHVRGVTNHTECKVFNNVLVNTIKPSADLLNKYAISNQCFVEPDLSKIKEMGYKPIPGDYISQSDVVRHDPDKLAMAIMRLIS